MVNKFADNRTDVVRVTRDITQGHRLTEDDIAVITVGSYNLPAGVITDKTAVVGLYAACDMKKDDWFLPSKLNDTADSASDVFKSLDGKPSPSPSRRSQAIYRQEAISAKLKNGDVVSLIVYQNEDGEEAAFVPEELKYVRVITSTTADGVDKDELVQNDDGTYELPTTLTLLADPVQADLWCNMAKQIDFWTLLRLTQEYVSQHYAAALIDREKNSQLRAYIDKFLRDRDYHVVGCDTKQLIEKLYCEMCEYSILTPFLGSPDLEEINVNGWDDIALTRLDGSIVKLNEHFHSPQHAVDIIKRLLHHSGMIIDNAAPMSQGHLPGNARITALKEPIVDEERGVSVSIRLLHPQRVNLRNLIETEFATEEMVAFLCMCIRYGVPFVVAGATSSGKTTLLNAIMTSIPDSKRVFTIESGSRELSLVRRDGEGNVVNNVVHTLSRPSENEAYDISQEDLVVASLRFNPDIVCVGEMRDIECYSAVEASLTGHTVVSTVHAGPGPAAHMRIALLCQKRFPIDFSTSLMQAGQAFPLVVYAHKLENNARKIMDISECIIGPSGEREYRCLYNYEITKNTMDGGRFDIEGHFGKPNLMSDNLKRRLIQYGVPQADLNLFLKEGMES